MKKVIRTFSCSAALVCALIISGPVFGSEKSGKDSAHANKTSEKDGHEHKGHESHDDHEGHSDHDKKATGTGKTSIQEISAVLHENLACLDKEIASPNHDAFHACLETIEALGVDLIALKAPVDTAKKKRVNGYAKNLGMMAHKVDEYIDGKQPEKAKNQLDKLKTQVEMILKQFPELENREKSTIKKEAAAKETPGHEGHGH
jgi:hypothetical protein